jgi:uncharacterized phiE125 gp8 family phage protein
VSYIDRLTTAVVISPAMYSTYVGGDGIARLTFSSDVSWPVATLDMASVVVRYQAGYGPSSSDVDDGIRQAILMTIARLYANRGDGLSADFREDRFIQSLFAPYQVWI